MFARKAKISYEDEARSRFDSMLDPREHVDRFYGPEVNPSYCLPLDILAPRVPVEKVVEICSRKDPLNWAAFIDYFAYLSGLIRGLIQVEDKETSQVSPELCILASDERLEEMLKKYCSLTLINLYNSLIKIDNDYSFLFQLSETGQGFAGGGQTERLSSHQSETGGKTNLEKMRGDRSFSEQTRPVTGGVSEHFDTSQDIPMPRAYTPPVIFTISDTLGIPVHTLYQLIMVMEIPENLTSLFFIKPYNPLLLDPKSLLRIEKRDKQYKQLIDQGFSRFDIQALNAALAYMPRKKTAVKRF